MLPPRQAMTRRQTVIVLPFRRACFLLMRVARRASHERQNKKDGDMPKTGVFRLCRIGILAATVAAGPAAAQTPVKVAFDWKFEGPAAPFLVAIDRGFFAAEGLDVSIEP